MNNLKLYFPLKPYIKTQGFGENLIPLYKELGLLGHPGIDCHATHGQPLYASHDGEVVNAGIPDGKEGYGVVLRTLESFDYGGEQVRFKSIYWHMIKEIPVHSGQIVKAGDLIGYADNTGASTGDHLHWALKPQKQGEADWQWFNLEQQNGFNGCIDLEPYFNNQYAQDIPIMLKIIDLLSKVVALLKKQLGL